MASTNAGLYQGNITWCLDSRGDKYHWVIALYDRLNLPFIPAITEALIKCVQDHADQLPKQQTGACTEAITDKNESSQNRRSRS